MPNSPDSPAALPGPALPGAVPSGLLLLLLLACSGPEGGHEWGGTLSDSSGVVIVTNPEEGIWPDDAGWRVREELKIGSFGADARYQFGQVGTIAVSSDGEIFVSDLQSQDVRVFSRDGTHLRTIGGAGSGPGEMGHGASVVLLTPWDILLVPDQRNRRINRFRKDGSNLGSAALNPSRERPLRFKQNRLGDMAAQLRPFQNPGRPSVDPMDAVVRVDTSGSFGDTLLKVPSGGLFEGSGVRYFTSEPMWDLTDSLTVVYGVNSDFRIGYYDGAGVLRRVVTKPFEPQPITERDIRAIHSYLDRAWLDAGVSPSRLAENRRSVAFADFFPAYFTFEEGPEGTLWVQRVRPPGELPDDEMERYNFQEDFGAPEWDVFDSQGRYLGVVEMPPRFQPRVFQGEMIYGVWRDGLDVQHVLRLRIRAE